MKFRIFYIVSTLALIFSSLAFFITPSVASAATSASGLGNYEASYCKNEPNPGDCETALSQGFNDANSSKNNKTSYCNQYAPNTSGRVGAIGGTPNYGPEQSCSYGYQQGQDKVGGLSYCSDYMGLVVTTHLLIVKILPALYLQLPAQLSIRLVMARPT
jgi:hypothetical protein